MTRPTDQAPFAVRPYESGRHGTRPWAVVKAVFEEYGFPFSEHGYDDDLLHPDRHYDGASGWFWVADTAGGEVLGCVALTDEGHGLFELHRLYVANHARRLGVGEALCRAALDEAAGRRAARVVLYSDIAFTNAHRLYRRLGFRNHRFRYAPDPWQSREWGFILDIAVAAG